MLDLASRQTKILAERDTSNRLRSLRSITPLGGTLVLSNGRELINFSSNDYLGLSQHPLIKERAIEWLERYGTGCGASRLVSGNIDAYEALEEKLAHLKGTESALIMGAGFQTNVSLLSAVASDGSYIVCDRLSHNSLLQGVLLSRCRWTRFDHNDLHDLEKRLSTNQSSRADERWVVTESTFSMDGDQVDVDRLLAVAARAEARLLIDEAHSTGVLGPKGMGLAAGKAGVDLIMGTFGKACGSFGSYVACSKVMRDFLINVCSGFIYSTGLPPPVLGSIDAALDLIPQMGAERQRLAEAGDYVRSELKQLGFSTANSSTQIIPVIAGGDEESLALSTFLEEHGLLAMAIRPPTVPEGTARVRLSLSTAHSDDQIELLVSSFKSWRKRNRD